MKKVILFALLIFILAPCLTLAEQPPLTKEEIKADFVANMMRVTQRSGISLEITDRGSYYEERRDGVNCLGYAHLVYIFWEGSYGQKIRESVEIDFIRIDGRWIFDKIFKYPNDTVFVIEPTKPLPPVPEKPATDLVIKLTEQALPRANDLMERFVDKDQVYKINKMDVGEPVFEWRGFDYENAAYGYTGTMEYTLSDINDKKHKYDQIWTCDCKIMLFYNIAKQKWECSVNTTNAVKIK